MREAYERYLSQETIENGSKEDQKEDSLDICTSSKRKRINTTNPIILVPNTSSFTLPGSSPTNPSSLDHKCAICDQELSSSSVFIKCSQCDSRMHRASECIYGIIQYHDEKTKSDYCSLACFKKYTIFEVEIVGEAARNYKIKYSNGDIMTKGKRLVEKHAEFYKILTIYRQQKHKKAVASPIDVTSTSPEHPSLPNIFSSSQCCCVCLEKVDPETNWHTCKQCKKTMHGTIVCPKRELIRQDDDLLFCSSYCQNIYVKS